MRNKYSGLKQKAQLNRHDMTPKGLSRERDKFPRPVVSKRLLEGV